MEGYLTYLEEENGLTRDDLNATRLWLKSFSREDPLVTRLSYENGKLIIDSVLN